MLDSKTLSIKTAFGRKSEKSLERIEKGALLTNSFLKSVFPGAAKKTHPGPCTHVLRRPDHISSFHQNLASSIWYLLHRIMEDTRERLVPRF